MDENSDKLATTQIATAALEHLTGPARGTASWLTGVAVDVSLGEGKRIRIVEPDTELPQDIIIARLHRSADSYEIEARNDYPLWINGNHVVAKQLEQCDLIEFGDAGPLCRYRLYQQGSRIRKSLGDIISDCIDYTRVSRKPRAARLLRAFRDIFRDFAFETTLLFRLTVIAAIVALFVTVFYQNLANVRLQQQAESSALQMESFARTLARTNLEALRLSDLNTLRQELDHSLTDAAERLDLLERRSAASTRVIAEATRSVVFLQGVYGFRDTISERMLRHSVDNEGQPLFTYRGEPLLTLEGDGEVARRQFTGTAFVVGPNRALLTNRHVAKPWEDDTTAEILFEQGMEPVTGMRVPKAYFIIQAARDTGRLVAIMLDLQGPKIRVGRFKTGAAVLEQGGQFVITTRAVEGDDTIVSTTYASLPKDVGIGDQVLTLAIITTMTVLIIACPCALGLATPISIMVGVGKAAESGILIRNGDALQQAGKLDTIILDKTGTITEGHPSVTSVVTLDGWSEEKLLLWGASLEQGSEHPLAEAIVEAAKDRDMTLLKVEEFNAIVGHGVEAKLEGVSVLIGNRKLMHDRDIDIASLDTAASDLAQQAQTPMYMAVDGKAAGLISVADAIKPDSKDAIQRMLALGLKVVLLTGDNQSTAVAVARQVGISEVIAEVLPQHKADKVASLQAQGKRVGMVGDGINDAPALARSDVGFAIGTGTDVAIESADITLMRGSIHSVVDAIAISKATVKNIKQNLFGAFIYNSLGIPIAAGLLYPLMGILLNPMIAGGAMAMSSLTVVTNANRLRLLKPGAD
ncbi:MAG: heavy metal translocating P-type ATPase [Proteobacteria bacterium]|nr:heavy metal translocating P-type ATPase [Pseudomonadota bacterium]